MSRTKLGLAHRLYTGEVSYDFIKNRNLWYAISAVVLTISILALLIRGLALGIEFRGGTDFQAPLSVAASSVDDVRRSVGEFDTPDLEAQVFSLGDSAVRIQTRSLTPDETSAVRTDIADLAAVPTDQVTYNAIGASWGQQVSQQALIALVVFIALVMVLISVWFRDWKMAVAAVVALAHDVIITLGVYALVGFTVTPATLIGVLTILGYSLYDTVVVFDKVRENVKDLQETNTTYSQAANLAVNQVLVRSINTTIIGVLPVAALLLGGATLASGPLQDLGMALFVGMLAGTYSSIFIATPVLVALKEREPAQVAHREAIQRRIERKQARARVRDQEANEADPATAVAAAPAPRQQRRVRSTRAERRGGS